MGEKKLVPMVESYDTNVEYLYGNTYAFIEGLAEGLKLQNTLKALPLARKMHDGQFRKGLQKVEVVNHIVDEKGVVSNVSTTISVHLPYILHCLKVCYTLILLDIPWDEKDLDILYTVAILHDTLEDCDEYFPKNGEEYILEYGFPKEVRDAIKLLSKHTGSDEYELNQYFNNIKKNKYALLVKLADRSHNVEDLYNMKNIPKYIDETRKYFLLKNSIVTYGKQNYPEIANKLDLLNSKILSLTEATEFMLNKQEALLKQKDSEIAKLKEEIERLKTNK